MNIETDSRKVKDGDIFVAIKGHTVDGHDYIEKAIENGASTIVCEHGSYDVKTIVTNNSEQWLNDYLVKNYSKDFEELKFIGITGTNGKTTTAYLTSKMLTELGMSNAYIGTIGFYVNGNLVKELPNTTPDILNLYKLIFEAKNMGVRVIVMEVSSHSLCYGRINGLKFDTCGFTNLTEDHLDFHKTMDEYLKAKLKILKYLKTTGTMVVNSDDKSSQAFKFNKVIGVGTNGDYKIVKYHYLADSTALNFSFDGQIYDVKTNLLGNFNIYNYLMAVAFTSSMGYSIEDIIKITEKVYPPKGRNQLISAGKGHAIIDYAHTPDAVEKILNTVSESIKGKIITVIGCGGDRDPLKRPIMGKIASELSDFVIFTNDNPRTEDENKIMADILAGVNNNNFEVILDREEAIKKGILMLEKDDKLMVLGKGHEDYQITNHGKIHFSDEEVIRKYDDLIKKNTKNFS